MGDRTGNSLQVRDASVFMSAVLLKNLDFPSVSTVASNSMPLSPCGATFLREYTMTSEIHGHIFTASKTTFFTGRSQ